MVHLEEIPFHFDVLLLLSVFDLQYLGLHEPAVLFDLSRHLVEESVFSVYGNIKDSFLNLCKSVIVAVEVFLEDELAFTVLLTQIDHGVEQAFYQNAHFCLEAEPHELVCGSWMEIIGGSFIG